MSGTFYAFPVPSRMTLLFGTNEIILAVHVRFIED